MVLAYREIIMVNQATLNGLLGIELEENRLRPLFAQFGPVPSIGDPDSEDMYLEFYRFGITAMLTKIDTRDVAKDAHNSISSIYRLVAFHLHRTKHEGYSEYKGALNGGVIFGNTLVEVKSKLGLPDQSGGGGMSKVITGSPVPEWVIYKHRCTYSNYQFNKTGQLELITLVLTSSMGSSNGVSSASGSDF